MKTNVVDMKRASRGATLNTLHVVDADALALLL